MQTRIMSLPASAAREEFVKAAAAHPEVSVFLIGDGARLLGVIPREDAAGTTNSSCSNVTLGEMASKSFIVVPQSATLSDLLEKMHSSGASLCLVSPHGVDPTIGDVRGVITEREIARSAIRSVDLFSD